MRLYKDGDWWHVEITTESGEKKTTNTWTRTRADAERVCKEAHIADLEKAALAHRLTSDVVQLITASRVITVKELIDEWDEWGKVGFRSERSHAGNIGAVQQWARDGGVENTPINRITTEQINSWINVQGLKLGTLKVRLSALRALFRFAMAKRYIMTDPSALAAVKVRDMTHEQTEVRHKPVFTDAEVEYLLAKCDGAEPPSLTPGFFRALVILGRDLGLRLGDIVNLEIASFDFANKVVVVHQRKTGNRVEIPLSGRVIRFLVNWKSGDKRYLFPVERKIINDTKKRAMISEYFRRWLARIGFEGYNVHSLRATLATTMANRGASLAEIAKALGHTDTKVTHAYVRKPDAAKVNLR